MRPYLSACFVIAYVALVESACLTPRQFFVDCGATRSLQNSANFCAKYGMTLLNLTNSSTIVSQVIDLNQTLYSINCNSLFWFSSGNKTGILANAESLGAVLTSLLTGLGDLLGGVLNLVGNLLCSLLFVPCPTTTTPAPITQAITVCVRPIQQRVIQKCLTQSARADMKTFQFNEQPMYGGVIDTFASRSRMTCSGICSSMNECIGISYINGICSLYM
ncbi:unnamed protein product [Adineta ricciae]|uniref:Uncharacterized protein n=1 Tax=Adineta ricciae TaxID=249248 RepID=A0A813ZVE7_ADIRI|nr:unnamed protein product [Adineta ricciae]CAF1462775.1 unnamed protein product [Adineta ricciae]